MLWLPDAMVPKVLGWLLGFFLAWLIWGIVLWRRGRRRGVDDRGARCEHGILKLGGGVKCQPCLEAIKKEFEKPFHIPDKSATVTTAPLKMAPTPTIEGILHTLRELQDWDGQPVFDAKTIEEVHLRLKWRKALETARGPQYIIPWRDDDAPTLSAPERWNGQYSIERVNGPGSFRRAKISAEYNRHAPAAFREYCRGILEEAGGVWALVKIDWQDNHCEAEYYECNDHKPLYERDAEGKIVSINWNARKGWEWRKFQDHESPPLAPTCRLCGHDSFNNNPLENISRNGDPAAWQCLNQRQCRERALSTAFEAGQWVRYKQSGELAKVVCACKSHPDCFQYSCAAGGYSGDARDHELALPRKDEWWEKKACEDDHGFAPSFWQPGIVRWCYTVGEPKDERITSFEEQRRIAAVAKAAARCGCLAPVNFGKGH